MNFIKKPKTIVIKSPLKGKLVNLVDVPDPVFAEKMIGDGVAIKPLDKNVYAPVSGKIVQLFHTNHALGIEIAGGLELLLHLGLDTVKLKGEGFTALVEEKQQVRTGDKLFEVDWDIIREKAVSTITPVVITNMEVVEKMEVLVEGELSVGDDLYRVITS
ncbi:PTS glucose transporter subunit IIA [Iocasia frigidifontis]|uniref:PTS glucose transporter subunit IIA n=1 Tax=Iocasia fonsfrigidae TaxID=2682810 RepID=A0A8A7KI77_9FIRM|nr:PTS glucose transporter subunit IIA [Iocasia fonsfrigidae]QTL99775.1 PTS glucose transporter subunit IIA [Iocasia fonsfrigidae]